MARSHSSASAFNQARSPSGRHIVGSGLAPNATAAPPQGRRNALIWGGVLGGFVLVFGLGFLVLRGMSSDPNKPPGTKKLAKATDLGLSPRKKNPQDPRTAPKDPDRLPPIPPPARDASEDRSTPPTPRPQTPEKSASRRRRRRIQRRRRRRRGRRRRWRTRRRIARRVVEERREPPPPPRERIIRRPPPPEIRRVIPVPVRRVEPRIRPRAIVERPKPRPRLPDCKKQTPQLTYRQLNRVVRGFDDQNDINRAAGGYPVYGSSKVLAKAWRPAKVMCGRRGRRYCSSLERIIRRYCRKAKVHAHCPNYRLSKERGKRGKYLYRCKR